MNSEGIRDAAQRNNLLNDSLSSTAKKRLEANKLSPSAKAIGQMEPPLSIDGPAYKKAADADAAARKNNHNIGTIIDQYPQTPFDDIVDGDMRTAAVEGKGGRSRKLRNKKHKKTRKNNKRTTKRKHSNKKSKQTKSKK